LKLYPVSAVTGEGIEKLKWVMWEGVEKEREATAKAKTSAAAEAHG
jgi:translation initiation factor IF-2